MNIGFCCPRRLDAQLSGSFPFLQRGAGVLGAVQRVHEEPTSHPSVSNILLAVRRYLLDVGTTVREVEVVPFARTLHTHQDVYTYTHVVFVAHIIAIQYSVHRRQPFYDVCHASIVTSASIHRERATSYFCANSHARRVIRSSGRLSCRLMWAKNCRQILSTS